MLNSRALTDILTSNCDGSLHKRSFLMTTNGLLLAYSQQSEIRELRKQAALATLSWQEHSGLSVTSTDDTQANAVDETSGALHTLTLESRVSNLIIRRIQPHLLLVLEGNVQHREPDFEPRINAERLDGSSPQEQNRAAESSVGSSVSSKADSARITSPTSALALQRQRIDALAVTLSETLAHVSFKMPDMNSTRIF